MCNSRIKFGMFHEYVGRHFSAIASGHYAQHQICEHTGRAQLFMSADLVKDQTYFLCNMNQRQMRHARFPLGGLLKSQVREEARRLGTEFTRFANTKVQEKNTDALGAARVCNGVV